MSGRLITLLCRHIVVTREGQNRPSILFQNFNVMTDVLSAHEIIMADPGYIGSPGEVERPVVVPHQPTVNLGPIVVMRGSRAAASRQISPVPSVEALSVMISSKSSKVCSRIDVIASRT